MGREAPPLRPNQITPLGRSGDRACSQPQQPRPSARSGGEGQERAVASAARVGRTHSLSRLCERVLHIGRRQRIARREAKTRNRLGRGTTSDCTGRRAAEMVRSLQVDRAAPVNLGVMPLRSRRENASAVVPHCSCWMRRVVLRRGSEIRRHRKGGSGRMRLGSAAAAQCVWQRAGGRARCLAVHPELERGVCRRAGFGRASERESADPRPGC